MLNIVEQQGNLVHVRASEEVSANDYETVLIPAIEATLKEHNKLKLIYEMGPEVTGFSAGAPGKTPRSA